jgi:hypothetical protein
VKLNKLKKNRDKENEHDFENCEDCKRVDLQLKKFFLEKVIR